MKRGPKPMPPEERRRRQNIRANRGKSLRRGYTFAEYEASRERDTAIMRRRSMDPMPVFYQSLMDRCFCAQQRPEKHRYPIPKAE